MDGELDSVLALAARKPRATVDTLASDLLNGPSPATVHHVEKQLMASYNKLQEYVIAQGGGSPVPLTQAQFVERFRENYVDVQRKRAAIALAKIGGPVAHNALDSAVLGHFPAGADTLRPDVRDVVLFALDTLVH